MQANKKIVKDDIRDYISFVYIRMSISLVWNGVMKGAENSTKL